MPSGKSRAQEYAKLYPNDPLPLPEIACPELADFLLSVGPTMAGGMGEVPLTAQELGEWSDRTFTQLTAWEFESILKASSAYASEKYAAKDAGRAAPYATKSMSESRKKTVVDTMEKYFDALD